MKLLLDTHIWIWSLLQPQKLSRRVSRSLQDSRNELWLSPVSAWEILILSGKGRLELDGGAPEWIATALERAPCREAPLTHDVALATDAVMVSHGDPADRFLAATAKTYDLTLVTADENLLRGKGYAVLANR